MFLIESDTDNSIIIEHNKNCKVKCLKETPAKIGSSKNITDIHNMSIQDDESDSNHNSDGEMSVENTKHSVKNKNDSNIQSDEELSNNTDHDTKSENETDNKEDVDSDKNKHTKNDSDRNTATKGSTGSIQDSNVSSNIYDTNNRDSNGKEIEETDEEQDEDIMVMSRATRMSIMGVIPKENESDESDFIQSEDVSFFYYKSWHKLYFL